MNKSTKSYLDILQIKALYSNEIKKYKKICKANQYNKVNTNVDKIYHSLLKEYTNILQKEEVLNKNDFVNTINTSSLPPININYIDNKKDK